MRYFGVGERKRYFWGWGRKLIILGKWVCLSRIGVKVRFVCCLATNHLCWGEVSGQICLGLSGLLD